MEDSARWVSHKASTVGVRKVSSIGSTIGVSTAIGPLMDYCYEGDVLLPVPLNVLPGFKGEALDIKLHADWLVCKDVCIPEGADLDIELPVAERSDPYPQWGSAIAATRAAIPAPLQGWQVAARGDGAKVALSLTPPEGAADAGSLTFFPHDEGRVEPSRKQVLDRDSSGAYTLTLPVAVEGVTVAISVSGLSKDTEDGAARVIEVAASAGVTSRLNGVVALDA